MDRDSDVLASGGSWFHHWGARTEKSLDLAERELPCFSGERAKRPEVCRMEYSGWGLGFEHI